MAEFPVVPTPQPAPAPATQDSPPAPVPTGTAAPAVKPAEAPPAAPAAPAPAPAPVPGSAEAAAAEKRVKDAQAKMHEATADASRLRTQLNTILNHPLLGPVAKQVTQTPPSVDDPVEKAWVEYQRAPDDKTAFKHLIATAKAQSRAEIMEELKEQKVQETNEARAKQRDLLIARSINELVAKDAPDVPNELFWAMSAKAESETPSTIVTLPERLEWQVNRAIELSRQTLDTRAKKVEAAKASGAAVKQDAAAVMPGGGAAPATPSGGEPGKSLTFVEQVKQAQARKVTS